jgi:hypothetical protein
MTNIHRLGRGLLGYLIPFAPHAFVQTASVVYQLAAFASGVLADINTFYRYTGNSANLFHTLAYQFRWRFFG